MNARHKHRTRFCRVLLSTYTHSLATFDECSSQAPKRHLRALHHGAQLGLNPTKTTMWETPLFLPAASKPGTLIPYWNPADHGKTSGKNPAIQSGGGNSVGWGEFGSGRGEFGSIGNIYEKTYAFLNVSRAEKPKHM